MSFSIVDKKTGEVMQGGFSTENDALDALIDSGATDEEIANEYDVIQDSERKPSRTSYEDRKNRFNGTGERILSEVFPSVAEQVMNGNDGFKFDLGKGNGRKNWDLAKAGISDSFSLPGRAVSAYLNTQPKPESWGGRGGFDLGRRSGEDTNLAGTILRDPVTGITVSGAPLLAKGIQGASRLGKFILGGQGFARGIGGAVGGAGEGAALEKLSSELNDREPEYAIGAVTGGLFEGLGQAAQALLQKYGKNLVKAAAQSAHLGNTDRALTDAELVQFLSNERNVDAMDKILEAASSGRNMTPFVNDRGKALEGVLEQSKNDAVATLKNEPMLDGGWAKGVDFTDPSRGDMQRRMNALRATPEETEQVAEKTIYKGGARSTDDLNYPPERDIFSRRGKKDKKVYGYQSYPEYNIEKFGDKWNEVRDIADDMENSVFRDENGNVVRKLMNQEENELFDLLKADADKDVKIVLGYTPEKIISKNKFLGDRVPFSNETLQQLSDFAKYNRRNGFSQEFVNKVRNLANENDFTAEITSNNIRKAFDDTGRRASEIERAFTYAKGDSRYAVKKGYEKAIRQFADDLSEYADLRTGEVGKNALGQDYIVGNDKMKKYAYTYLARVQEILKKRGNLDAEEIAALYADATNVNDVTVQNAILKLLRNLKIPESTVRDFEKVGGSYAMLNKARTRMKRNANEDNPFKGTMAAPIYPQEGFNAANAIGYRVQKSNIKYGKDGITAKDDPTALGIGARTVYNLGRGAFTGSDRKDRR